MWHRAAGDQNYDCLVAEKQRSHSVVRGDIQGLRAFAVCVVVGDHLIGWPRGGFVGVDIFFVISGFLITGLLVREQERTGRISFGDFYRRRVKRILPGAALVIAVTLAGSWALFSRPRFESTMHDALWAAVFAANWRFASVGTDYFQATAPPSPLQHYWSLAVEEQFYLVWPLVMVASVLLVRRFGRAHLGRLAMAAAIGLGVIASYIWAHHESTSDATTAYFSSFSRFWELGLGALLAVIAPLLPTVPRALRVTAAWIGLLGLVASVLLISASTTFPAPGALLPVGATVAILWAGADLAPRLQWPLTNPVSRYIGDISYSLYLWHWPVIILGEAVLTESRKVNVVIMGVTFVLAAVLSYHVLEDPVRRSRWLTRGAARASFRRSRTVWTSLAIATLTFAVGVTGAVASMTRASQSVPAWAIVTPEQGLGPETTKLQEALAAALAEPHWPVLEPTMEEAIAGDQAPPDILKCGLLGSGRAPAEECTWGSANAAHSAVTIGDSTSMGYVYSVRTLVDRGWRVTTLGTFGCTYLDIPGKTREDSCEIRRQQALDYIRENKPDVVFSTFHYLNPDVESREEALAAFTEEIAPYVDEIVFVAPAPSSTNIGECYSPAKQPFDCAGSVPRLWTETAAMERRLAAETGASFIDSEPWFCVDGRCPAFALGTPLKRDLGHITPRYQEIIAPAFLEALEEADLPVEP